MKGILDLNAPKSQSKKGPNEPNIHSISGNERLAMCDPNKIICDDYWNLLNNTRDKKEGPDGIFIWNTINKEFSRRKTAVNVENIDQQVIVLTKSLIDLKIKDSQDIVDSIVQWDLSYRLCGEQMESTADLFLQEMRRDLAEKQTFQNSRTFRKSFVRTSTSKFRSLSSASKFRTNRKSVGNMHNEWSESQSNYEEPKERIPKDKNPNKEITGVRYVKDIGLIATSFEGVIKIFDAFNF